MSGSIDAVETRLRQETDVNARDHRGVTPLYVAARYRSKDIVAFLIQHGASPTARNADGNTPLHGAAEGSTQEVADLLIASGSDITAQNESGLTPLHAAAAGGNVDVAALLITRGALVDARRADGPTALYEAAMMGHQPMVQLLVSKGASINASGAGGTPLHGAALLGHKDVTAFLVARGADVNAKVNGLTPLHAAAMKDSGLRIRGGAPGGDHIGVAQLLLAHGAQVNAQSEGGTTPLLLAVSSGNDALANLLIAHRANHASPTGRWTGVTRCEGLTMEVSFIHDATQSRISDFRARYVCRDGGSDLTWASDWVLPVTQGRFAHSARTDSGGMVSLRGAIAGPAAMGEFETRASANCAGTTRPFCTTWTAKPE